MLIMMFMGVRRILRGKVFPCPYHGSRSLPDLPRALAAGQVHTVPQPFSPEMEHWPFGSPDRLCTWSADVLRACVWASGVRGGCQCVCACARGLSAS